MAKKRKETKPDTIVKNGKRVPASEKGKNPKTAKPAKEPKPAKPDKDKAKQAVARAVWKATEASRTTIGKIAALVDAWDENDQSAEALKDQIGGLKGQIAEHKAEMRKTTAEAQDLPQTEYEATLKKLIGLEKDLERWEVKLEGLKERRAGAREAMKCAMADIRKIIKDGPGLFDAPTETPAGKSGSSGTSAASPSTATTASASPTTKPAPSPTEPPPSTPASGPKSAVRPVVGKVYRIETEQGNKRISPVKVERVDDHSAVIANAETGLQRAQVPWANYIWTEEAPPGKTHRNPDASASDALPTSASTKAASTKPAVAAADSLAAVPIAEAIAGWENEIDRLARMGIKTLRDAAKIGKTMIVTQGVDREAANAVFEKIREVRAADQAREIAAAGA